MLDGYKSYLIAVLIIISGVLKAFDLITTEVFEIVLAILLGGGIASLRRSIGNA